MNEYVIILIDLLHISPSDLCLYFQLAEDVICHKADLRFVSISGQKVLDSVQGALEQVGGSDPALDSTKQLVTDKLQDANHRYTSLHTKVREAGRFYEWCSKKDFLTAFS